MSEYYRPFKDNMRNVWMKVVETNAVPFLLLIYRLKTESFMHIKNMRFCPFMHNFATLARIPDHAYDSRLAQMEDDLVKAGTAVPPEEAETELSKVRLMRKELASVQKKREDDSKAMYKKMFG